jgi:hypothetical protein
MQWSGRATIVLLVVPAVLFVIGGLPLIRLLIYYVAAVLVSVGILSRLARSFGWQSHRFSAVLRSAARVMTLAIALEITVSGALFWAEQSWYSLFLLGSNQGPPALIMDFDGSSCVWGISYWSTRTCEGPLVVNGALLGVH